MLLNFFPAVMESIHASNVGSFVFDELFFPDATAEACPEVSIPLLHLRSPCLLIHALWGIYIGFRGSLQFLAHDYPRWSAAFVAFGLMNVSAVCLHCLWPPLSEYETYPQAYPLFWTIDTYMTGLSSTCLFVASLETLIHQKLSKLFLCLQVMGAVAVAMFYGYGFTYPLELWYILPTLLPLPCLVVLGELLLLRRRSSKKEKTNPRPSSSSSAHNAWLASSTIVVMAGLGLDRFWCWWLGTRLYFIFFFRDCFTASSWTFLGCNLGFWGIQILVADTMPKKKKKKKQ